MNQNRSHYREHFSHDGAQGGFAVGAFFGQAIVEVFEWTPKAYGDHGGHVQRAADTRIAAFAQDRRRVHAAARLFPARCEASECRHLARPAEPSQFAEFRKDGRGCDKGDTWNRTKQFCVAPQFGRLLNQVLDSSFDLCDVPLHLRQAALVQVGQQLGDERFFAAILLADFFLDQGITMTAERTQFEPFRREGSAP